MHQDVFINNLKLTSTNLYYMKITVAHLFVMHAMQTKYLGHISTILSGTLTGSKNHRVLARPSLVAQTVKCLSTMRETGVRALDWEDPLEREMATHSSTVAWKIPWREEPGSLQSAAAAKSLQSCPSQSMGSQRVRYN